MQFQVKRVQRRARDQDHEVFILASVDDRIQAEVWPSMGCNCLRWCVASRPGPLQLLYAAPDWESNPVPTRSGIPVLAPFPNRIRNGRFVWAGRTHELPTNDSTGKNAIHGFACRRSWRVVNQVEGEAASLTCEFQPSIDAPDALPHWPGDYLLRLEIILESSSLTLQVTMVNVADRPIPFGLGFHQYFNTSGRWANCLLEIPANAIWELQENLPTGRILPVDLSHDLRTARRFADLTMDAVYTDLRSGPNQTGLARRGRLAYPGAGSIELWTSNHFRELVAFTPPHRQAVCLEPYTCTTDAVNLYGHGIDSGLIVLDAGESRTAVVKHRWVESSPSS